MYSSVFLPTPSWPDLTHIIPLPFPNRHLVCVPTGPSTVCHSGAFVSHCLWCCVCWPNEFHTFHSNSFLFWEDCMWNAKASRRRCHTSLNFLPCLIYFLASETLCPIPPAPQPHPSRSVQIYCIWLPNVNNEWERWQHGRASEMQCRAQHVLDS